MHIRSLGFLSVSDIAKIDTFRCKRTGVLEAVLAEGKSDDDLINILKQFTKSKDRVLVTRVSEKQYESIKEEKDLRIIDSGRYNKTLVVGPNFDSNESFESKLNDESKKNDENEEFSDFSDFSEISGRVAIITAGTADIPVAEEAAMTARETGCKTYELYDVGVAGYQRLLIELDKLNSFDPDAIVVAAGREGTLPTVVAGILDAPVIGLPVSTGYGIGSNGKAAFYSMIQSCSVITVVNIDAGFVAGAYAAKIANRAKRQRMGKS
ncbi:MAG: nickel pincer cofactor biosynthesis protein LarB [Methanosarcinaceae archaeon]|nr:nickel pincer cofactor biosynthesis protein LarB [Methanosarcinaceae archaeon]